MQQAQATIVNKRGLHARASSKLASLAGTFSSNIHVIHGERTANAKSIMELMMLAASVGSDVTIDVQGSDEKDALSAICTLISAGFEEED